MVEGHAWLGGMHGWEHAWLGACMDGGGHVWLSGVCMTGAMHVPPVNRQTPVKTLPSPNFVGGR